LRYPKALFVLCGVGVAASAGCQRGQTAGPPGGSRAVAVKIAPVSVQDVVYEIKALGSLEPEEMVQVTAEVEGAVTDVRFHEGDRVSPARVLLRIDPERYRLEAQRAEAAYKRTLADQHRAEEDLRRREELARERLVAAEELNRSRQEAERLVADSAAAKAARDIALQNVARSEVRPSRTGSINTKTVETGQFVKTGNVLATLVDTSRLRLRFRVSEGESLRARPDQDVQFKVRALADQTFPARIYHVAGVADPTTRQVEVLAWVKNPGVLKPGFFAEVTLASESRRRATVVPEGAVQASEKGFVTYVIQGNKAQLRSVEVGLRTEKGVEILSGVSAGESVIVEGSDRLSDGVTVQPVREASAPPSGGPSGQVAQ